MDIKCFRLLSFLNKNYSIPGKTGINFTILFNFLPQNAMDSFAQVKFSLVKILLFGLKLYFISLLILISFFLFTNAFLQYLRLTNLTMVFLLEVFQSDFPILWHASISLLWTITSTSYIMEVTTSSKSSSATSSEYQI